jgi:nucleotide-binding universal stress UspA family protein
MSTSDISTSESTVKNTANQHTSGAIVVGVDGSPQSEQAVLWAAEEARLQRRTLTLVHCQPHVSSIELASLSQAGVPPAQVTEESLAEVERIVDRAHQLATDHCADLGIETMVSYLDVRTQLLDLAETASMLVVGTRGHGSVMGLLLGSVSSALVRHAQVPVAVVRTPSPDSRGGVLLAADGSEDSLPSVETAFREAAQRGVPLTIGHCLWDALMGVVRWTPVSELDGYGHEARLLIAESMAGMAEKYPDVKVDIVIGRGTYDAFVLDQSTRHDLLVIGRPPLSLGQRLLLNGLTTSIAEHAHSPVLVVP